jgi:transcriptional regulator with XRE-family HTH domain
MTSKLEGKLQNHAYRTAFVASQINVGIPFQIKALMKARGWTQQQFAQHAGMLQPRISAILKPGKVRPNIETLRRIAEAFDCGLLVRFAPFSELYRWSDSLDPEKFDVPAFKDDAGFKEPENAAASSTIKISPQRQGSHFALPTVAEAQQAGGAVLQHGITARCAGTAEPRQRPNVGVIDRTSGALQQTRLGTLGSANISQ